MLLLLVAFTAHIACAIPVEEILEQKHVKILEEDDNTYKVDLNGKPIEVLSDVRDFRNQYILFTRRNPTVGQTLRIGDPGSIFLSNFNPSVPTVAVCHGYTQSQDSTLNQVIRDAFLAKGEYNVIILDWSSVSQADYVTAISSVPAVGQGLGQFLSYLNMLTGAPIEAMHLIGFSLGGHVAGNAGKYLGGRVTRVTGLDSVSPIWLINSNRLASTDGIYVECIHTYGNGGTVAWGDADFYVNGGESQPGCWTSICSHNRSWQIFAATVTYNHMIGRECNSEDEIKSGNCNGSLLPMGNGELVKRGRGTFYVTAGISYPY